MSTSGPSHFAEVGSVVFTPTGGSAINIFSVSNIRISRTKNVVKGMDNTKQRPVSAYVASVNDEVSFECEDMAAMISLEAISAPGVLAFDWKASTNQLTTSPLANQAVTISGLVIDSVDASALSKGLGKGTVKGFLLEQSAGADPVAFAAG